MPLPGFLGREALDIRTECYSHLKEYTDPPVLERHTGYVDVTSAAPDDLPGSELAGTRSLPFPRRGCTQTQLPLRSAASFP